VDSRGEELSSDPYLGYDQKVNVYYSYPLGALRGSTLVLGVSITGVAKAYPLYLLRRPISDVVAEHRLRIVPDPDASRPRFTSRGGDCRRRRCTGSPGTPSIRTR
jgi:hypothetical protein